MLTSLRTKGNTDFKDSIFGIGKTNDLVVNGRSILKYVGSYVVDQNYLLAVTFGTHSNFSKLLIAELKDILTDEKEINYTSRAVERGAMLIGYETGGTRVWLQMPRGQNFIFPFWRNHVFLFLIEY